jgi:DNA-binding NtrC family response regulator
MATANPTPTDRAHSEPAMRRILLIGHSSELSKSMEESLRERHCGLDHAAGSADALRRLRRTSYDVVITDPSTSVEEDLALLSEMRSIRPGLRVIVLAPNSTPEEVITALRARVFLCKTPPFDAMRLPTTRHGPRLHPNRSWGLRFCLLTAIGCRSE